MEEPEADAGVSVRSAPAGLPERKIRLGWASETLALRDNGNPCQLRARLASWLKDPVVETALALLILFNFVLVIMETDAFASSDALPDWMKVVNGLLLSFYSIELLIRLFVYQRQFFDYSWNNLDFLVVGTDIMLQFLPQNVDFLPKVSILRIFRLMRLARALKALALFPELNVMLRGLASTAKAVCWGMVMLSGIMTIWAVLAVHLINPINRDIVYSSCERCPRAFSSVWQANLTFIQQIIAGDSWGMVTVPIIEKEPWTAFFFVAVFVSISLLVMNLILAVIVEKAQEAHKASEKIAIANANEKKEAAIKSAAEDLHELCVEMDTDHSGTLTLQELLDGYDKNSHFASLSRAMDLKKDDLTVMFDILNHDAAGSVFYSELIEHLKKMKTHDQHTLLLIIMHHVHDIMRTMANEKKVPVVAAYESPQMQQPPGDILSKHGRPPTQSSFIENGEMDLKDSNSSQKHPIGSSSRNEATGSPQKNVPKEVSGQDLLDILPCARKPMPGSTLAIEINGSPNQQTHINSIKNLDSAEQPTSSPVNLPSGATSNSPKKHLTVSPVRRLEYADIPSPARNSRSPRSSQKRYYASKETKISERPPPDAHSAEGIESLEDLMLAVQSAVRRSEAHTKNLASISYCLPSLLNSMGPYSGIASACGASVIPVSLLVESEKMSALAREPLKVTGVLPPSTQLEKTAEAVIVTVGPETRKPDTSATAEESERNASSVVVTLD